MLSMWTLIRSLRGPRVYRLYRDAPNGVLEGRDYKSNALEYYSDISMRITLGFLSCAWSLGVYGSPLLAIFMYRKGYLSYEMMLGLSKFSGSIGCLVFVLMFLRGLGRTLNSNYNDFIQSLDAYKMDRTMDLRVRMSRFDFDFHEWPVDFSWKEAAMHLRKPKKFLEKQNQRNGIVDKCKNLPCDILSFMAIHTFGRLMIYPGSIGALNLVLSAQLLKGRATLVEDHSGQRFKLLTKEGNEIDSMFVERRNDNRFPHGDILVICCEGNAGFYEIGITGTPIDAGYSVLGWNHPGFAYSTGLPFPDQELSAMDVVVQFAVTRLGFPLENIVLYAWSIGGFSATWAAMNYPDIKGLVLDATFDDLVHLAIPRMPASWTPLVKKAIRDHMDLNNAEQLIKYNGPVILIRRSKDEIISIDPARSMQTNRGNYLLVRLLRARYPNLANNNTLPVLQDWVSGDPEHQRVLRQEYGVDDEFCKMMLQSYGDEHGFDFPMLIGEQMTPDIAIQLLLFLANKHMFDYDSTHCTTLPARRFHLPWDPLQRVE